jgi:hypothetical protein
MISVRKRVAVLFVDRSCQQWVVLDPEGSFWFLPSVHGGPDRPALHQVVGTPGTGVIKAIDPRLGERWLYCEGDVPLLFTENETNTQRIFSVPNRSPYVKDSINTYIVHGQEGVVNPEKKGTKVAAHYRLTVDPGACQVVRLRLSDVAPAAPTQTNGEGTDPFGGHFEAALQARRREADEFYAAVIPASLDPDAANVMRQALAGMLWSKQFYHYDVDKWLEERGSHPFKATRKVAPRNDRWHHMYNGDVISMPDKWEYPWYAAWDLAFHVLALTLVDEEFGKQQLKLMLRERYLHPNGQIPAYDRSAPLPTGGYLEQADGTAWMALFCQNMIEIAAELARTDADYAEMGLKFIEHFLWIAAAMVHLGQDTGMWDEEDGFFYDVLRLPNGEAQRLKVRSMVGLLPLCAATVYEGELEDKYPEIFERFAWFIEARPELVAAIHDPRKLGYAGRRLGSILDEAKLRRVLATMLDENEFLSPYGLRSLSRYHAEHPYVARVGDQEFRVSYMPAESDSGMFGGNSNWRGPIWLPVNGLIIRALLQYYLYYGNEFTIECPTGSGQRLNLYQVAEEITRRLSNIFLRDKDGRRPVYGGTRTFQDNPHWRDYLLFYEYFHGDNGAGLGASHQTGWTGIIARLIHVLATVTPEEGLEGGKKSYAGTGPLSCALSDQHPCVADGVGVPGAIAGTWAKPKSALSEAISLAELVQMKENSAFSFIVERGSLV